MNVHLTSLRSIEATSLATALALLALVACSDGPARTQFDDVSPTEGAPPPPSGFEPGGACPEGVRTTVSGKVYAPSGELPIYAATVYAPTTELSPIASGASCDGRCGVPVSGAPRAATLSKADGSFTVEVAPGTNVPLVVQLGKWRRKAIVPKVEACKDNVLADPDLTRLPRSGAEGDLPKMAIETGAYDALECLLLRLGVDAKEITAPGGAGHVHLYRAGDGAVLEGASPAPGKALWSSKSALMAYDAVFFECAGPDYPSQMTAADRANVVAYANAGGRVFATDYAGVAWVKDGAAPFPTAATWSSSAAGRTSFVSDVDRSFPKGRAFGEWLYAVHATTQPTAGMTVRSDTTIVPKASAVASSSERWLYAATGGAPLQLSFNAPIGKPAEEQCGRVIMSDFHVSDTSGDYTGGDRVFPSGCAKTSPTPQELALAFLIFDLGSCIQDMTKDPIPPR